MLLLQQAEVKEKRGTLCSSDPGLYSPTQGLGEHGGKESRQQKALGDTYKAFYTVGGKGEEQKDKPIGKSHVVTGTQLQEF